MEPGDPPQLVGPYSLGALIVFVKADGEFGTPVTLGNAIGYEVLVSSIDQDVSIDPLDFSQAAASSSILFSVGVVVWALQQWISRRDLTSGGQVVREVSLRLSRPGAVAGWLFTAVVVVLTVVIPFISIVLASMTILRSAPPSPSNLAFDYFRNVLIPPLPKRPRQADTVTSF